MTLDLFDAPVLPGLSAQAESACSRVSSICQVGIVGFKNGVELF